MKAEALNRSPPTLEFIKNQLAAARESEARNRRPEALLRYHSVIQQARGDTRLLGLIIEQILQSCRRSPKDPQLRHLLGGAYLFARDLPNAEAQLRQAAELAPRTPPILVMLADCLVQGGKTDEALVLYRKAVELAPDEPEPRMRLAALLAYRGERAEARDRYQSLFRARPRDPLVVAGLIEVSDYAQATEAPTEYSAADSLANNPALPPALRRMLHFSAAKIDRALGRTDEEFQHYLHAKQYFPHRFDLTYFSELVQALKEAITPEFYAGRRDDADASKRPVFIFGMPRSGTTLAEQILAAHSDVAAAGELTFFSDAARELGINARRSEGALPLEKIAERMHSLDAAYVEGLAAKYLGQLQWRGGEKIRVTDKMPGNFLHLWLMALVFPLAGYIHCFRDPMATCFSCFTTDLGDAHAYTQDLATLGRYYRLYEDLMRHWGRVLPVRIMDNRYEELVLEPEAAAHKLLKAAEIPWDPGVLSFHQSDRVARTASYAAVREPVHPRSLQKWRDYERYLGPLKEALGDRG